MLNQQNQTRKMLRPTHLRPFNATPVQSSVFSEPPPGSRIHRIMNAHTVTKNIKHYKFRPVMHPDLYYADLESHGMDSTKLRALHKERPPSEPPIIHPKIVWPVPEFADTIPVTMEVKKGRVRVRIRPGMFDLYQKNKKGHKASIEERVLACRDFGYPNEVLIDMMQKHEKRLAALPELEEFMISVFGEMSDKKTTAPKKKTLYQVLKIKKAICAMPEPEEIQNEDAGVEDNDD